jgi:hypothetical protein
MHVIEDILAFLILITVPAINNNNNMVAILTSDFGATLNVGT